MQLIVTVPNENVMSKVIKSLKAFQNDGVEVTIDVKSDTYKMLEQIYEETKDEFLKIVQNYTLDDVIRMKSGK